LGLCVQVHARGKKIEGDVDWELIARGCAGWTGADIAVSCPAAPLNAQGAE
jgi:ATP-dependent Zn protease